MPKTGKNDHARKGELPSTLQRSDQKAQDTFAKTYDSAMESYDNDPSRAARTAFAALKHSYEKVGDHWEPKEERGPSDAHAEEGVDSAKPTAGGCGCQCLQRAPLPAGAGIGYQGPLENGQERAGRSAAEGQRRRNAKGPGS